MSITTNIPELITKWDTVLTEQTEEPISVQHRADVTAQLLENQSIDLIGMGGAGGMLTETTPSTLAGNAANYDPILIKLVRRMAPKLIAFDFCGVQAMSGPTELIFAMRARYTNAAGGEALLATGTEADTAFSGTGTHNSSDPFDVAITTGTGKDTVDGEADAWNEMTTTIEKTNVVAKTRQLKSTYSDELAQDLRAIHGLNAENELASILTAQIVTEINREIVRTMYAVAPLGAATATLPGTFDLATDADGRWSVEKFKGLLFQIERDANAIAISSARGKGNVMVASADVASALALAGILDYAPALNQSTSLEVDVTGTTYAGMLRNRIKVFIDPYAVGDFYCIGYKGAHKYDAGFFYCPYVPLQLRRAVDQNTLHPIIGFKTRYGIVANPFTTLANGLNTYYRKVKVVNLI